MRTLETTQVDQQAELKHSKMGIASFLIAIIQGIITCVVVSMAGIYASKGPQEDHMVAFMIIGIFIVLGIITQLAGAGLGIAGILQKNRKKLFAILGLVINVLAVLFVAVLMVMGSAAG